MVTRAAYLAVIPEDEPAIAEQEEENGDRALAVVIDGNRRLAGARRAGTEEMAIIINDAMATSAAGLLEKALTTTLHKEQLTPLDEARALAELMKVYGTHRAVGQRIGRSHVYVGQRLALLNLSPELQARVDSGELPLEDARQAARAAEEDQRRAAEAAQQKREKRNAGRRSPGPSDAPRAGNGATSPPCEEGPDVEPDSASARTESPAAAAPSGSGATSPDDSADPAAIQNPAPNHAEAPPGGTENGTTPPVGPSDAPPSGSGATTETLKWDDLPALAAVIRQHLGLAQRQTLASLISTG